jgi:hypothetical protein
MIEVFAAHPILVRNASGVAEIPIQAVGSGDGALHSTFADLTRREADKVSRNWFIEGTKNIVFDYDGGHASPSGRHPVCR